MISQILGGNEKKLEKSEKERDDNIEDRARWLLGRTGGVQVIDKNQNAIYINGAEKVQISGILAFGRINGKAFLWNSVERKGPRDCFELYRNAESWLCKYRRANVVERYVRIPEQEDGEMELDIYIEGETWAEIWLFCSKKPDYVFSLHTEHKVRDGYAFRTLIEELYRLETLRNEREAMSEKERKNGDI